MQKRKNNQPQLVAIPQKSFGSRASFILLFAASASLLIMSSVEHDSVRKLRAGIVDIATPALAAISKPIDTIASIGSWVGEMVSLRSENVQLKNANIQLLQWQSLAKEMDAENASLRELLNVVPNKKSHYITARIVSDVSGPFVRSALLGAGSGNGIKKDQAVINERGLVGRVVDVGDSSSRVLLISDINSRVPVIGEDSREKAIMVGNNSDLPTLSYISSSSTLKVGERIVTSGDGGVFPKGIVVGVVESTDRNMVRIQPFVDAASLEYVSVVDYSL